VSVTVVVSRPAGAVVSAQFSPKLRPCTSVRQVCVVRRHSAKPWTLWRMLEGERGSDGPGSPLRRRPTGVRDRQANLTCVILVDSSARKGERMDGPSATGSARPR